MTKLNLLTAVVFALWAIIWTVNNEIKGMDLNPRVLGLIVLAVLNLVIAWAFRKK